MTEKDHLSSIQSKLKTCTILFSDIRNFTRLTSELGAVQVVDLLNKYLNTMADAIDNHNGILDKFIGDAIMAVFGLPHNQKLDPKNAVKCGLEMIEILEKFNEDIPFDTILNIGIGISTGTVVSGNIGPKKKSEYTVIGNSVNLASRLENETKKFKVNILICETTYNLVSLDFHCREIDTVLLKGINTPIKIYTVIKDKKKPYSDKEMLLNKYYSIGLKHYYTQNYQESFRHFKLAHFLDKNDGPTLLFIERCTALITNDKHFNQKVTICD